MERFVKKIVDLMMAESLFSWQGGPIILLQVLKFLTLNHQLEYDYYCNADICTLLVRQIGKFLKRLLEIIDMNNAPYN